MLVDSWPSIELDVAFWIILGLTLWLSSVLVPALCDDDDDDDDDVNDDDDDDDNTVFIFINYTLP